MTFIKTALLIAFFFSSILNIYFVKSDALSYLEFRHISTDKGLSQKTVQSIFQDSHGFIWIGTQEGLNRYDGKEMVVFRNIQGDEKSLSSNVIRDILEDDQGSLWVATSGGLNRYDPASNTFFRVPIKDEKQQAILRIYSLYKDKNGRVLIGTDGNGVYVVDTMQSPYQPKIVQQLNPLKKADVRVLFKDTRGRLWIGTDGQGIWLVNEKGDITNSFLFDENQNNSLSHNRIRAIMEDSKGQIWIGTRGGGLNKYNELNKNFIRYKHDSSDITSLSNNRVYKIIEDDKRSLWIATDGGVNIFRSETDDFLRVQNQPSQPSGLSHNRILTIYQDFGGLIWLGTLSGVNIWNPVTAKFVHYRNISEDKNSLTNNTIFGMEESKFGDIYVATFGGGLNYLNAEDNEWSAITNDKNGNSLLLDLRLMTLMVDNNDKLWVGSFSKGVSVLSKDHQLILHFEHDKNDTKSLSANGITDVLQDSDNEIWVATYTAGLNRLNRDGKTFLHYRKDKNNKNTLISENILQILEDDEGYIWLATDGGGLSRLDKNTGNFINFTRQPENPNSLTGDATSSIYQDSRGRFWIGTQGRGLNRWEPEDRRQAKNNFKHYTMKDGLPSSTVNGVLEDDDGYIWVSTNKGVSRLDPETDEFKHYNLALEIHNNELNQGSMLKANNGRLYFGGLNGIGAFFPKEIASNSNVPPIVLTNISSENKSVNLERSLTEIDNIKFSHKDYLVTFEFAALDYSQPDRNQYKYKLEGFDPDWIEIENLGRATYTNLPSGTYIFKVMGSNNDNVWSDESINLRVIIEPAPWVSWWAFIMYASLFCMSLIILIRSQAKRIANQDLFQKKVAETIESKTALYEKDNLSLKEQVKNYQVNSGNDLATGLPNQSFFTEQLLISLSWLKKSATRASNQQQKLCCIILKISNEHHGQIENRMIRLAQQISSQESDIMLISRWNVDELAMLGFVESNKRISELVKRISILTVDPEASASSNLNSLSLGYSLVPLHQNDEQSFKWENVLMLTEHAMRNANEFGQADPSEVKYIGLSACHQKLSPALIKTTMTCENLLTMKNVFDIDSNI